VVVGEVAVRGKTVNVVFGLDAEERDYEGYTGIGLVYRGRVDTSPPSKADVYCKTQPGKRPDKEKIKQAMNLCHQIF